MRESIKKVLISICAVSISIMVVTSSALAATPRPQPDGENVTTTQSTNMTESSGQSGETATQAPVNNVATGSTTVNAVTQTSNETTSNKKYLTKMGGFLWFLLSVIVNFIVSCWVGNKFYKLARKSTQSSAEVRALRRDIEEKFASTIRDISEPATEVINRNESYARTDEGITMPERKQRVEINEDEREIFRKWDSQRNSARTSKSKQSDYEDYDDEEDFEESRNIKPAKSSYQPTRRSSGIEFDEDEYEDYDDEYDDEYSSKQRPSNMRNVRENDKKSSNGIMKAKGRAKEFLSNVFPFDE